MHRCQVLVYTFRVTCWICEVCMSNLDNTGRQVTLGRIEVEKRDCKYHTQVKENNLIVQRYH
jgi:hypothetical protein